MDEDPCTGEVTERLVASGNPEADARNKWSLDIPRNTNIDLYTRSYMIRISDKVVETDDGILAGQYSTFSQSQSGFSPSLLPWVAHHLPTTSTISAHFAMVLVQSMARSSDNSPPGQERLPQRLLSPPVLLSPAPLHQHQPPSQQGHQIH